jgi:hypothetical protein
MHLYDLLGAWFQVADWVAYDLAKDGTEGVVLKPLGQHSKASTFIVLAGFNSDNYRHRKIAASLAGWIEHPPLDLLAQCFQHETERDHRLPKDDFRRLDSQSVVEDIVFSAAFWARRDQTRPAAFELLRKIIERSITGEYWNTASYAMTTLCRHQAPGCAELLNRFQQFSVNAMVEHPSMPSLTQEREFADNLLSKNSRTLDAIEDLLNEKVNAATAADLDESSRRAIEDLLKVAQLFDSA